MRLAAVVRCAKCKAEFALVPGYTESDRVCWGCLHPEARATPTAPAIPVVGPPAIHPASGEAPRPEPSILSLCEA